MEGSGKSPGHLVIVGGHEQRTGEMTILERFVKLAADGDKGRGPVLVLTAATEKPEEMWQVYERGFRELGMQHCEPLHIDSREQANDPALKERLLNASGIFMTGGNQTKLMSLIGGTKLCDAMRMAYVERNACIAGTSAGASAFSEHMLSEAPSDESPLTADVRLVAGLGFLLNAVIDQHFSERGRFGRLLAAVAHNPKLVGVGIDENTALVVRRGHGIEIIGDGAVTLLDGRDMRTTVVDREGQPGVFQASNVRVHLLPAGGGFITAEPDGAESQDDVPDTVRTLVKLIAAPDAVDTQFRHD